MLGLIQQLWAVKGSDPPPSPALEQGLSTLLREHASFLMSFFFWSGHFLASVPQPAHSRGTHKQTGMAGGRSKNTLPKAADRSLGHNLSLYGLKWHCSPGDST